jgi:hypothetical protein
VPHYCCTALILPQYARQALTTQVCMPEPIIVHMRCSPATPVPVSKQRLRQCVNSKAMKLTSHIARSLRQTNQQVTMQLQQTNPSPVHAGHNALPCSHTITSTVARSAPKTPFNEQQQPATSFNLAQRTLQCVPLQWGATGAASGAASVTTITVETRSRMTMLTNKAQGNCCSDQAACSPCTHVLLHTQSVE